jgi:hypothetical protein
MATNRQSGQPSAKSANDLANQCEGQAARVAQFLSLHRTGRITGTIYDKPPVPPLVSSHRLGSLPDGTPDWVLDFRWTWKHGRGESEFFLDLTIAEARSLAAALLNWAETADALRHTAAR